MNINNFFERIAREEVSEFEKKLNERIQRRLQQAKSYEHPRFRPGQRVYIDPFIRIVHKSSPVAGALVTTCVGSYFPELDKLEGRDTREELVPVLCYGEVWLVEEEYVNRV
jgi:hypothetical protein